MSVNFGKTLFTLMNSPSFIFEDKISYLYLSAVLGEIQFDTLSSVQASSHSNTAGMHEGLI